MATLVDLYQRWNNVTNWAALARSVDGAYIKYSDGTGLATTRADAYVAGCKTHGIPYGGYCYGEPGDPAAQADGLVAAYQRYGGALAPALDLESGGIPVNQRDEFARAFLSRVHQHYPIAVLYASTSWLSTLRPDTWPYPWDLTWAAEYGINNGARAPIRHYTGRVDMHQYTSAGRVPGISGLVDIDHTDNLDAFLLQEADMTPEESRQLADIHASVAGKRVSWVDNKTPWDLFDFIRWLDKNTAGKQTSHVKGSEFKLSALQAAMNADAYGYRGAQALAAIGAQLSALQAAVAAKSGISKDELAAIVNDAVAKHVNISGSVSITGDAT